jgi:hypothetical protein
MWEGLGCRDGGKLAVRHDDRRGEEEGKRAREQQRDAAKRVSRDDDLLRDRKVNSEENAKDKLGLAAAVVDLTADGKMGEGGLSVMAVP